MFTLFEIQLMASLSIAWYFELGKKETIGFSKEKNNPIVVLHVSNKIKQKGLWKLL